MMKSIYGAGLILLLLPATVVGTGLVTLEGSGKSRPQTDRAAVSPQKGTALSIQGLVSETEAIQCRNSEDPLLQKNPGQKQD